MFQLEELSPGDSIHFDRAEPSTITWRHNDMAVSLICQPFGIDLYSSQTFWYYSIKIAGQSVTVLDYSTAQDRAQAASDARLLPSLWDFRGERPEQLNCGTDTPSEMLCERAPSEHDTIPESQASRLVFSPQGRTSTTKAPRRIKPISARKGSGPRKIPIDKSTVSKLLSHVMQGATTFLQNDNRQVAWQDDMEMLKPRGYFASVEDLVQVLDTYAKVTEQRSWQAVLLLACSIKVLQNEPQRIKATSCTRYRRFATYVVSLINALSESTRAGVMIGVEAFKIVPALSDTGYLRPSLTKDWTLRQCEEFAKRVAAELLAQPDQSWTRIDSKHGFDPAEHLLITDRTTEQIHNALGLRVSLQRGLTDRMELVQAASVSHSATEHDTHVCLSTTSIPRELILPAMLPYDSNIFMCIQEGDVDKTRELLSSKLAHIHTIDPYGLGLLYYAAYYCARAQSLATSFNICKALVDLGAVCDWVDDISNEPKMTLIDSAIMINAMSRNEDGLSHNISTVALIFASNADELWSTYVESRGFSALHLSLFGFYGEPGPFQQRLTAVADTSGLDAVDYQGRTALAWAVEYRWAEAVQLLIELGSSVNSLQATNEAAALPLLHLAIAGPSAASDTAMLKVVEALVFGGADANAVDRDGWTALHIAASWNLHAVASFLLETDIEKHLLTAGTLAGETAFDLAVASGASFEMLSLLFVE